MPPQSEPHVAGASRALWALSRAFGPGYFVRPPAPLRQGPRSKPEPDVAVVPGTAEDYLVTGTPSTAFLVVEISDTTLWHDRNRKASLYAKYDIRDYWIVNLVNRQIEIHRDPITDTTHKYGFRYNSKTILKPPAEISPLAKPNVKIPVLDFLP